jgi:TolB-like protein
LSARAPVRRSPSALARSGVCLVLAAVVGCAGSGRPREHAGAVPTDHPRIALLPFDNLSGREEQERRFTHTFLATLVKTGACEVVDLGRVEAVMESQRLRSAGALTPDQMTAVGESLDVRYLMLGSILEAGTVRTQEGDAPTVGASLRLVEVASGRIVWADVHVRTGDDRETIFGWGRERSAERLLTRLAEEMLQDFRRAGASRPRRANEEEATQ